MVDYPPTVEIISPRSNERITGSGEPVAFTVRANAGDDFGLSRIEVYLDNTMIRSYSISGLKSYYIEFTHSANSGTHTLRVTAYDTGGKSTGASVSFTIAVYNPMIKIQNVRVPEIDLSKSVPAAVAG